jgi:LDH2 family malate/lactate/ureidoglycolate dehydrogenase
MDSMIEHLKTNKRRSGVEEILIPGERSARAATLNEAEGVLVGDETIAELERWCKYFGVAFDAERLVAGECLTF